MRNIFQKLQFQGVVLAIVLLAATLSGCTKSDNLTPTKEVTQSKLKAAVNPKANADAVYNGFINAFKVGGYFVNSLSDRNRSYFWNQGIDITAMCDAYDADPTSARRQVVSDLCSNFLSTEGTGLWTSWNIWNDDIAWTTIPMIRGYMITGNTAFRDTAKRNWDAMYARAWDGNLGGGLWENHNKQIKEALSNNPNIIVGMYLYQAYGDANYLSKCQSIYSWVRSHLYASDNHINRGINADGSLSSSDMAYNNGSFVNAACALYKATGNSTYLNDAKAVANHIVSRWPILTEEGDAAARGVARLARENNLGSTYYPWLANNCASAWNNRRTDYNITWNDWTSMTNGSENNRYSMEYVSAVTVQMVTPEQGGGGGTTGPSNGTYKLINRQNGLALTANGTANLSTLTTAAYTGSTSQRWTLTSLGNGNYKLIGSASGRSIDVTGNSSTDGTAIILYDYNNQNNQNFYFSVPGGGYYIMYFVSDGKVVDLNGSNNTIDQWGYNGGANQQWQFLAP